MPKLKPPPGAAAGAAGTVTWTLVAPKLNPPNELPEPVVAVAMDGTAVGGAAAEAVGAAAAAVAAAVGGAPAGWDGA